MYIVHSLCVLLDELFYKHIILLLKFLSVNSKLSLYDEMSYDLSLVHFPLSRSRQLQESRS
jgi:hypothetical protein